MAKLLKYGDLHNHLTLKPFLNTTNNNYSSIWEFTWTTYVARSGKARTNVQNLINGQVKIIFPAMGYIEKGWQVLHSLRFKIPAIFRNVGDLFIFLLDTNFAQINDFYNLLVKEMDYLYNQRRPPIDIPAQFRNYELTFPHNGQEFELVMEDDSKIIALPSIEGAHALISGTLSYDKFNLDVARIIDNIKQIKQHPVRPVFITFTHHFFNGLAGHAHSIYELTKILDQSFGLGNPIGTDGWRVIRCLLGLDASCGQWPILIDTKHFSLAARRQYYDFVSKEMDYSLPIINSHAAYSGSQTIENVIYSYPPFSHNQTNISAEEVYHIWRSKGLIGINFDQNVLWAGPKVPDAHKIMENIVSMVQGSLDYAHTTGQQMPDETIWDIFSIGTDFDGFIDPVDSYPSPLSFAALEKDLLQVFSQSQQFRNLPVKISTELFVRKFMQDNIVQFARRYFDMLS